MDNLKERLTAKLGPLPVWAWGIIAAVIAFVSYLYYRRSNTGVAGAVDPSSIPTLDSAGYQTAGIKGGSGTITSDEPDTNQKWLNRAAKGVADSLGASPSEVFTALSKWLQGLDYSAREKTFIDKAIQLFMLPPEGTFGIGSPVNDPTDATRNPNSSIPGLASPIGVIGSRPMGTIPNLTPAKILSPSVPTTPVAPAPTAPPVMAKGKAPAPAPKPAPAPPVAKATVKPVPPAKNKATTNRPKSGKIVA